MDIACHPDVVQKGRFRYDLVVQEVVKAIDSDEKQPVADMVVKGQGGAGESASVLSALRNLRVMEQYLDC